MCKSMSTLQVRRIRGRQLTDRKQLEKYGEFFPFAMAKAVDGKLAAVAVQMPSAGSGTAIHPLGKGRPDGNIA